MSDKVYNPKDHFDISPQQYHAGLDKLWTVLEITSPQKDDVFTLIVAELTRKKEELAELRNVCSEAYQMAGQIGAATRILDNLSAAAAGRPLRHETFLPVTDEDFAELTTLRTRLEELKQTEPCSALESYPCPCPALPEKMVVVSREDLRSILEYHMDKYGKARDCLKAALEKKP